VDMREEYDLFRTGAITVIAGIALDQWHYRWVGLFTTHSEDGQPTVLNLPVLRLGTRAD